MKAISSPQSSPLAGRTLKLVGVILILSFLLDFVILSFPFKPLDKGWQINFATLLVDRGVIPMVGIGFLFAGYWIDDSFRDSPTASPPLVIDLRFWTLLFSSLLGLLFLLIFPLHLNNVRQLSAQKLEQINQDATQKEAQLQNQLGSPDVQAQLERGQSQFKNKINSLIQNEQQYNQALQGNQIPPDQKKLLQQFKADPKSLEQFVQQQFGAEAFRNRGLTKIRGDKQQAQEQIGEEAWKSGLRIGISSLLLSIGYIVIGWTGLRSLGILQPGRRKASAR